MQEAVSAHEQRRTELLQEEPSGRTALRRLLVPLSRTHCGLGSVEHRFQGYVGKRAHGPTACRRHLGRFLAVLALRL